MTSSPSRHSGLPSPPVVSSPRTAGRLRQMKSAHNLAANYNSGPSLISQQRHQQQQQLQQGSRIPSSAGIPALPSLPHRLPSPQKHDSPAKQGRTRANSDLAPSTHNTPAPSPTRKPAARKPVNAKDELDSLVRNGPKGELPLALANLRHWILCDGMDADSDGMSHLRIYVWLILLNAPPIPTDAYLALTRRGPSPAHAKICNDTFRTFKTNPLFKRRVTDNSLVRLLNAVAWSLHDAKQERQAPPSSSAHSDTRRLTHSSTDLGSPELQHTDPIRTHLQQSASGGVSAGVLSSTDGGGGGASEAGGSEPGIYVQGMNVLCAPFLYASRSEPEAYAAFHRFITTSCPGYVRGAMDGVHQGIRLVDRCLAIVDPKLSHCLLSRGVKAEVYAFASVLTMCACTPPLPEVLALWDFLLAYGAHLNILCVCAQLIAMRESLLASASPGTLLRAFPALEARKVIMLTVGMVAKVPEELYEELVHHAQ